MAAPPHPVETDTRVLLLAPTRRDAEITRSLLERAAMSCLVCPDLAALQREVAAGAGAVLTTEEALAHAEVEGLLTALEQQPPWSDLPVVLLVRGGGGQSPTVTRRVQALRNVTLLERPAPTRSVVSAVQAAVRSRLRQYQLRDQIETVSQAQARSRQLQEELALAIEASELGTFHCDMPLGKIVWNQRSKALFWLPPDAEVNFEQFYAILHPDDRERTRQAVEACVFGGKLYDMTYRTVSPAGEIRWVRATGRTFFDARGEPLRFDGTTQDVTERERREQELRESQERFQAMANAIPQLAWMAKPDGFIFWYNQRWHDYCGTTPEQMEGWGWQSVHDPAELPRIIERWKAALANGESWEDTFPLRRRDGEFRWHLSRARPLHDASHRIVLWFGTNTDVTEERTRTEERERLLEAERAARIETERTGRMKDEFLATLSHELRTPLNAILGWSTILRGEGVGGDGGSATDGGTRPADDLSEGLAIIERNARAQHQIIEDLLDMSRIISGKVRLDVQRLDLAAVVEAALETVRPAAAAKAIRLQTVLDPRARPVSGDPNRLQQVFWNLLGNAIKFTPRGGRIQVLLERVHSHLEVRVSDSGQGVAAEFLPFVFDRFQQADASTTRAHGGLGLGLAIVKQLVELHGGTVRVESPGPGAGATFTVALPLTVLQPDTAEGDDAPPPAGEQGPRRHPRAGGSPASAASLLRPTAGLSLAGVTVLVVDDEADARALVGRLLLDRQATVHTAASAAEALELVRVERPDVLVSDVGMPGEDGYSLIRRVRALGPGQGGGVPALALTAYARAEDRVRAVLAGFQMHVAKPVEPAELLTMVASLAGRTGAT